MLATPTYQLELAAKVDGSLVKEGTRVLYNIKADKICIVNAIYVKALGPEETGPPMFWFIGYLMTNHFWSFYCEEACVEDPEQFVELGLL